MKIVSTAFAHDGAIPPRYTCDGADVSPPLAWSGVPQEAKSLALIVDEAVRSPPAGTREGLNDWKRTGYGGPCPPVGRHRYFHKLYALDVLLPDLHTPRKAALEKAMKGHVIATAELVGTYQKRR